MSNEVLIVLEQVVIIALLLLIGYVSIKLKVLDIPLYEGVAKFTIHIALPALIFSVITKLGGRPAIMNNLIACLISFVLIWCVFGVGKLVALMSGLKMPTSGTHISATAMGNLGYIGIPMVSALYGNEGLLILSVYMIFDLMLNWTIGLDFMEAEKQGDFKTRMKRFITPLNITLVVALIFLFLNIEPSGLVFDTIKSLGATTKYLSIIYLGAMLAVVSLKGAHKQLSLYLHGLVKLIIFPVLVYVVGTYVFHINSIMLKSFVIIMALPTMPSLPIFAKQKGGDEPYAVKITFLSTLKSLVTIPLVVFIISLI